jgi:hypothetical protein
VMICERNSHKRTGMWTGVIARDPRVTGQPRAQVCVSVHPNVSYHRNCGRGRTPYESREITTYLDCELTTTPANASGTIAVAQPTSSPGGADGRLLEYTCCACASALAARVCRSPG